MEKVRVFTAQEEKTFEELWLKEKRSLDEFAHGRELFRVKDSDISDDEFISYSIFIDQNIDRLYKKHFPETRMLRGDNPNIIFHGGCLGCLSQRKHGIDRCKGCRYFRWRGGESLFIKGEDSDKITIDELNSFLNDKTNDF